MQTVDEIYSQWYDGKINLPNAGRVGAKRASDDDALPKPVMPTLKVGFVTPTAVDNKFTIGFPEAIKTKFKCNDVLSNKWAELVKKFEQELGAPKGVELNHTLIQRAP